jgi:hypothetical protein
MAEGKTGKGRWDLPFKDIEFLFEICPCVHKLAQLLLSFPCILGTPLHYGNGFPLAKS